MYTNDYMIKIVADQQQRDLFAAAANSRLASLARNGHLVWWRRLVRSDAATATPRPAPSGITAPSQPVPC